MLGWTYECQTVMSVADRCAPDDVAFVCGDCRTALCRTCSEEMRGHCKRCTKMLEPLEGFLRRVGGMPRNGPSRKSTPET